MAMGPAQVIMYDTAQSYALFLIIIVRRVTPLSSKRTLKRCTVFVLGGTAYVIITVLFLFMFLSVSPLFCFLTLNLVARVSLPATFFFQVGP